MVAYTASVTGFLKQLYRVNTQKILYLNVGAPVLLTVNLSQLLVNGLSGTVTQPEQECVKV